MTFLSEVGDMQKCQVCGKTGADEFYSRVNTYCKEHWREVVRVKRKANAEKNRAYEKTRASLPHRVSARNEYSKTESGKVARARATEKFVENYPLKRTAHNAVNNAVRDGRIRKKPCEICGNTKSEAHHDDLGSLSMSGGCVLLTMLNGTATTRPNTQIMNQLWR